MPSLFWLLGAAVADSTATRPVAEMVQNRSRRARATAERPASRVTLAAAVEGVESMVLGAAPRLRVAAAPQESKGRADPVDHRVRTGLRLAAMD